MTRKNKYRLKTVLHLSHNQKEKVWGIISSNTVKKERHQQYFWCWWAEVGKGISLKKHWYSSFRMSELELNKKSRNYKPITEEQLLEMWPNFYEQLEHKMIFEVLSDD